MTAKEVTKGSIIWIDGWWFVVVEQHGEILHCICDNANNIYSHQISDAKKIVSAYGALKAHGWDEYEEDDELRELVKNRVVPVEVIAEVLAGCHDDRFHHWRKS